MMINFIVNAKSGKSAGAKALAVCGNMCVSRGIAYSVHATTKQGDAEAYARKLSENGDVEIVAIGGDGTFHEVLNGIDPERATLGFVPAGSGNDFARAARLSSNPEKAFAAILHGEKKYIDYIQVGERRCLNVAGTGMDVDVLEAVYGKNNAITYYTSLVARLMRFKPYDMRIKANGQTIEKSCIMVGVCNGTAFGGGIRLSPFSSLDDGLLNVIIMEKTNRSVFKVLPKFTKGKHMDCPETTHFTCEEIEIVNYGKHGEERGDGSGSLPSIELDGEIYNDIPFNCKVIRKGLKTFSVQ